MKIVPVILCGGSGTRLWPLSRENHPKQFVDLGGGRTLFKDTLHRIKDLPHVTEPLIVCNEIHRFFVTAELKAAGMNGRTVLEPAPRNTAPAIALAAELLKGDEDCLMLVMPADHYIQDVEVFRSAIEKAVSTALENRIVAFGVAPQYPATGYGYIRAGKELEAGCEIAEFIEKPAYEQAKKMLAEGNYFWNAGIFLMNPGVYLSELSKNVPEIAEACRNSIKNCSYDNTFIRPQENSFLNCPEDSIDYAVMEKTSNAAMIPLNVKWSDLGSWEAFFQQAEKDELNNVTQGDVLASDTRNSYLHSSGRLLATIGVDNLMVVETSDAVIVAKRQEGQRIKEIVASLKKSGRYHYKQHPLVYKPWGSFEILAQGERFQVKRLIINPGESLSLQYHHHRAEHWIIVSGTARICLDGVCSLYTENQSVYIPIGSTHMIENPGKIPLILIEVQSGSYLGEDDIIRKSDKYGRARQAEE